jgi:hypothetical protein
MSRKASFALFAGLALVLANAYRDTAKANGWGAVASSWKTYGLEAAVVVVAAYVANMADRAATVVLLILAVLWLLFAMHVWGWLPSSQSSPASGAKSAAKTKTPPASQSVPSSGPANVKRIA